MNPDVSVIIPTYKDWDRLALCLAALQKQSYPQEKFEIIVVNNDPEDKVPANFNLAPNTIIIHEAKTGSYAARNAGLKLAQGSIIGFTDADCIPHSDWIKNAVSYLHTHPQCSRVAGYLAILQKQEKPSVVEVYNKLYAFPQRAVINNTGGSVTGNLFTYKAVFDKVGPFNDSLRSYGDLEWGSRAKKAGFQVVYVEDVIVYHPPRSFKELVQKEKRLGGGIATVYKSRRSTFIKFLRFLFNLRPSLAAVKTVRSRSHDLRIRDMIMIPFIRYYFRVIRSVEHFRVQIGKEPNRS